MKKIEIIGHKQLLFSCFSNN